MLNVDVIEKIRKDNGIVCHPCMNCGICANIGKAKLRFDSADSVIEFYDKLRHSGSVKRYGDKRSDLQDIKLNNIESEDEMENLTDSQQARERMIQRMHDDSRSFRPSEPPEIENITGGMADNARQKMIERMRKESRGQK